MSKLHVVSARNRPPAKNVALTEEVAVPDAIRERLSPVVLNAYSGGDFHRVDMRSLAREAGMSFATIYRHFGDKEALLFWFIDHWFRDLYPHAVEPLSSSAPAADALFECLKRHLEFYERHPKVGRIVFLTVPLDRWMQDDTYHQHEVMSEMLHFFSDRKTRGELRDDVGTVAMLDAFVALFQRTFLMWEYRRRRYSLVAKADETFRLLWGGIASQTPSQSRVGKSISRARKA